MKKIITFITIILITQTAHAGGLGLRRVMNWEPLSQISEFNWSGYIEIKIDDSEKSYLADNKIFSKTGKLLFDASKITKSPIIQGFGIDLKVLNRLYKSGVSRCNCQLADLSQYYRIKLTEDYTHLKSVLQVLNSLSFVEVAYPISKPVIPPADIPPQTDDYSSFQGYFESAPQGTGVFEVSSLPGANGEGIHVVDVEYNWHSGHEDLEKCASALIPNAGTLYNDNDFAYHGTAVLGIIFAGNNGYGMTGAAFNGNCHFSPGYTSEYGYNIAHGITQAVASVMSPAIILLEAQEFGPNYDAQTYGGLVPVEWIPATYDAIRTAVANGYIIVEAGANGWEDLDDPVYSGAFDRETSDSGAIMVGAGLPGWGTSARQREWYSNFGSRMDVQGWGSEVYTLGYGDLFNPGDINQYYTSSFGGTSSASPIVTGTIASIAGILRASGSGSSCSDTSPDCPNGEICDYENFSPGRCISEASLSGTEMRDLLASTGTPQLGNTSENIGPLPDIESALDALGSTCGDNQVSGLEACDDGNTVSGDGCSADCRSDETCGNGYLDPNEVCDDGNTVSGDGCSADCNSDESCGNGYLDINEVCDDGNTVSGDGCNADCTSDESCGNSIIDTGELCDDGNTVSGDGCSADCKSNEICGNGYRDINEECDDGNLVSGDGCSDVCIDENPDDDGCTCSAGHNKRGSSSSFFLIALILGFGFYFRKLQY